MLRAQLEGRPRIALPPARFKGAGIYALYYTGAHALYAPLVGTDVPVYVGKAEAGNSSYGDPTNEDDFQLHERIRKHAGSIRAAVNLDPTDFEVRYLPLDDAWIVLGERAILRAYRPVLWNTIMNGFGSNEPGTARANARSVWDTQHPGRRRAGNLCHRHWTFDEQVQRIERAVELSLQEESDERTEAIDELRQDPRREIWRAEVGGPIQVLDRARFDGEMQRLGLAIPTDAVYAEAEVANDAR
ncbi:MAG: Eco29kI family restriction endonuclease [Cellulomonas sp.]|nr:Eco29kI family restriction endonuclease [Cellulomonas sp.]MCR6647294.1 Eco29kI family restriction endonuclease [Cellulomonas sp.]